MDAVEKGALRKAQPPEAWPSLPDNLTYSTLREFEACPRRWALSAASYPKLWAGRGYPPRLSVARLAGTIVHDVIDRITRALVKSGCPTIQTQEAVQVMRDMGGFTRLLEESTERTLRWYTANPRAAARLDAVRRTLQSQFPDLRRRAQALLMSVRIAPGDVAASVDVRSASEYQPTRRPLGSGAHSEVEVIATEIKWKGKIDLLTISEVGSEIVDFKTGEPSDDHAFQVRLYALLWSLDHELNPSGMLPKTLIVAYTKGQTVVPAATVQDSITLRTDIVGRSESARRFAGMVPPAKPSPDNCANCDVRHICDDYWTETAQRAVHPMSGASDVIDGEFVLGTRLGTSNWEVATRVVSVTGQAKPQFLRCSEGNVELSTGAVVRVVDGRIWTAPDEKGLVTLNVGPTSEIYVVPKRA